MGLWKHMEYTTNLHGSHLSFKWGFIKSYEVNKQLKKIKYANSVFVSAQIKNYCFAEICFLRTIIFTFFVISICLSLLKPVFVYKFTNRQPCTCWELCHRVMLEVLKLLSRVILYPVTHSTAHKYSQRWAIIGASALK